MGPIRKPLAFTPIRKVEAIRKAGRNDAARLIRNVFYFDVQVAIVSRRANLLVSRLNELADLRLKARSG